MLWWFAEVRGPHLEVVDLSAYDGATSVLIRFRYEGYWDWWWEINDVVIQGDAGAYTVTYNANGATGGNVPVDGSSPYVEGATVTVLGNTGSLVRDGFTFSDWNTAADGSGIPYSAEATFSMPGENVILHAQWSALMPAMSVPTLNEWGMIILSVLACLASVYYLYKRREDTTA